MAKLQSEGAWPAELWRYLRNTAPLAAKYMGSQQGYCLICTIKKKNQEWRIRRLRAVTPWKCHDSLLSFQVWNSLREGVRNLNTVASVHNIRSTSYFPKGLEPFTPLEREGILKHFKDSWAQGLSRHQCLETGGGTVSSRIRRPADNWRFGLDLAHSVSTRFTGLPTGHFLSSSVYNGNRHTWHLAKPSIRSLAWGVRVITLRKANWKPSNLPPLPPLAKIVDHKPYHYSTSQWEGQKLALVLKSWRMQGLRSFS